MRRRRKLRGGSVVRVLEGRSASQSHCSGWSRTRPFSDSSHGTPPAARLAAAAIALVGVLFSAYLLVVQLVVIDAVCAWCVANDVVIAPALALLTGLRLRA